MTEKTDNSVASVNKLGPVNQAGCRHQPHAAIPGKGRILVVEDLDLVLELTVTALNAAGYEAVAASNAETALEMLLTSQPPFDLLFTDYNLKGMNGGQLIEKAAAHNPHMKFILTSGFLDEAQRAGLRKIAKVWILDKPFKMRDAIAMVAKVMASGRETRSTKEQGKGWMAE